MTKARRAYRSINGATVRSNDLAPLLPSSCFSHIGSRVSIELQWRSLRRRSGPPDGFERFGDAWSVHVELREPEEGDDAPKGESGDGEGGEGGDNKKRRRRRGGRKPAEAS